VPEVWFWNKERLTVYQLQADRYEEVERSQFYPELNLQRLIPFLNYRDQFDAVQDFTAVVQQGLI
jgi:hypothetical protein